MEQKRQSKKLLKRDYEKLRVQIQKEDEIMKTLLLRGQELQSQLEVEMKENIRMELEALMKQKLKHEMDSQLKSFIATLKED